MNSIESEIWQRLTTHDFDSLPARGLTRALMREHGWHRERASRSIAEYRRFLLIAATTGQIVSPSADVDAVWHAHVLDSREYFGRFCLGVLRQTLHHVPASDEIGADLDGAYARTLERYEVLFGAPPPWDVWPRTLITPPKSREGVRALPWLVGAIGLGFSFASASLFDLLDQPGPVFLRVFAVALVVVAITACLLRHALERALAPGGRVVLPNDTTSLALLAGGPRRVTDLTLGRLKSCGAITASLGAITVTKNELPRDPIEEAVLRGVRLRPRALDARVESVLDSVYEDLERRGLVFTKHDASRIALASAVPAFLLLLFGVTKLFVGLARGRPVSLLFLMLIAATALFVYFLRPRPATPAARSMLAKLREAVARAGAAATAAAAVDAADAGAVAATNVVASV